jgi:hypothetical protein
MIDWDSGRRRRRWIHASEAEATTERTTWRKGKVCSHLSRTFPLALHCMHAGLCVFLAASVALDVRTVALQCCGRERRGDRSGICCKASACDTHTSAAWRLAVAANLQAACARMLLFFSFVQRQIVRFSFLHLFLSSDCNDRRTMDLQAGRRFKSASRLRAHPCPCMLLSSPLPNSRSILRCN